MISGSTNAADNMLTQAGSWSCVVLGSCPFTPFPVGFGGIPKLVVFGCNYDSHYCYSNNDRNKQIQLTSKGFLPSNGWNNESGIWIAIGPGFVNATVTPKYLVLTVIYAPPGMKGRSPGTISYQENNAIGTNTSVSKSFKQGYAVSVSVDGGFLFDSGGNDLKVSYSRSVTDKESMDIKVSKTGGLKGQGSTSEDGVNNDNDAIYLALSPTVKVQMAPSLVEWTFANPREFNVTYVYVAWLKDPALFQATAPAIKQLLYDNGITERDYVDILKQNPLACSKFNLDGNGALHCVPSVPTSVPPSDRYELQTSFAYVPPSNCSSQPLTETLTFQRQTTHVTEYIVQEEYSVAVTHRDTVEFGSEDDGLALTMSASGSWTWINQSASARSTGITDTATLAVGGPSCGFNRATHIDVYFDKIYKTYAFRERSGTPTLQGSIPVPSAALAAISAAPTHQLTVAEIPGTEVKLVDAVGHEQRTFTNEKGEWKFMDPIMFPARITANGVTSVVREGAASGP